MTELRTLSAGEIEELSRVSRFVASFEPERSVAATREAVASIDYWYQSIYLGHGLAARGSRDTFALLRELRLPASLRGKTVVDIGSAEGFFSFECEARGAERVTAIDHPAFRQRRPGPRILKELFSSSIELVEMDVAEAELPVADVVLFLGVLYHLEDPLRALRRVRQATRETLYLETHIVDIRLPALPPFGTEQPPIAVFYPRDELAGDRSNWWGPNLACLLSMVEVAGFENIDVLSTSPPGNWNGRAVIRAGARRRGA